MLLPSFQLAVIAILLGSMIATRDLIFSLKNPHVPDEIPNFFDMLRYQNREFGYSQVNFNLLAIIPYFSYQIFILLNFTYGVYHAYLRTTFENKIHWELLLINGFLILLISIRLYDNIGFKVRRFASKFKKQK